ncbi:MAG: PspC domain-containing protein [Microthrixaceae bacterium]
MESQDMPEPEPTGERSPVLEWFRSLRRSSTDRVLTGVAGGLAERIGVPALVVRAAFVLTAFAGFGIPVYLIAWVLVPTDKGRRLTDGGGVRDLVALAIIVIAGLMLTGQVGGFSTGELIWRSLPWAVMLVGAALILRRHDADPGPQTSSGITTPPPYPSSPESELTAATGAPGTGDGSATTGRSTAQSTMIRRIVRPPVFPVVGLLTWCLVLIVCGALGALTLADVFEIGPGVIGAVGLVVFGVGLVFSAFRGKARGLILPSLALAVVFAGLGAVDVRVDNFDGPFNVTVSDAAELPSALRTSVSDSSLNLRDLKLTSNRYLRIDQTAGGLRVVLPADVNVKLDVRIGLGEGSISRPDRERAVSEVPDLGRKWLESGIPEQGDPVDGSLYHSNSPARSAAFHNWWEHSPNFSSGISTRHTRTVDQGGQYTLDLEIHMGVGAVQIIDPHWSEGSHRELTAPTQLCTVGGGERGVVKPCGDVPAAKRVALCINESLYLVDCREDRPATADYPRVPACRGFLGEEVDCAEIGVEPVGAQLTTPGLRVDEAWADGEADDSERDDSEWDDDGLEGQADPPDPTSTIRMPDATVPNATVPNTTVGG